MPEMDGFDVVRALEAGHVPAVVFVTAYDEYAVRAFEVHALDYLLKPFSSVRFKEHSRTPAIARSPSRRRSRTEAARAGADPLGHTEPARFPERLLVRSTGRVHFVRTSEIDWCEAAGNYVRLHLRDESHLFRETMNGLESKLDPRHFARIHRSTIVNVERIEELRFVARRRVHGVPARGTKLTLSRGYREGFQERFGKSL